MVSSFKYLIFGLVISFASVAYAQQDSLPEKYTKKVLIEAKWGNGPGEFQLEPLNEIKTWTTYLALDKQGNIYITDPNNYRINIFDQNGSYINTLTLSESDVIEKNKLPPQNIGNLIQGIGVDSKGHVFIGLSAFGTNSTVLELDKNGKRIGKYFFPNAYVENFSLHEKNGSIYLSGLWCVLDKSAIGYQYVYASIPLSLTIEAKNKNENYIVEKIKALAGMSSIMSDKKTSKNGLYGYESRSGDIVFENKKGCKVLSEAYNEISNLTFDYSLLKGRVSITLNANALFDDNDNFYLIQGKSYGLEVLKCNLKHGVLR